LRDKVLLKGMIFYAYHGVMEAEKELGQRFIVDLEISLDLWPAGDNDDLALTVNYAQVYDLIQKVILGDKYDLIETVAQRITQEVFKQEPRIEQIKVLVKKPEVPIAGILDYAAVELVREREK